MVLTKDIEYVNDVLSGNVNAPLYVRKQCAVYKRIYENQDDKFCINIARSRGDIFMTIWDFKEYFDFETKVKITTKDDKEYIGIITGIENDFETNSGKDEIELDVGSRSYCFSIIIDDIVKVEPISKK